ncbi:MAG: flagellar basal body-associated FliL family protein [Gemmatimonadetes bacterium]|jgi:flagellar basal body-associated protein FliL|nr:flagellar basal body-associated FliL family protein [Gemmatimonadota bacterium]MBT4608734.1 flagellar basal body-associated FliL family protein [Gemmatimonadota bacterium]MBT5058655.1 flagellar basal body-associated FliL family protein [Gemmatimonadota bacterium]MBT5144092.1 flagellar basal body-associated FliL family protein [Gemmatimonadota bacterium]MBT5586564.1 flagellar basal body-associated FliL family protein [Gemmatimonadota bacterium]
MSEEEAAEEGGGGGGGGSALKKYGPLAAIVLLAQVVLAWVVITVTVGDKLPQNEPESDLLPQQQQQQQAPTEEGEESDALPYFYTNEMLDQITANPAGTNAQRFVVAGVQLGLTGTNGDGEVMTIEEVALDSEMTLKVGVALGLIKSVILEALSTRYIDQIENERAQFLLDVRDELNRKVFNKIPWGEEDDLKSFRIQEVIFTKLIIQ